ncbi:MAG: 4Fe-4S binding protein [Bacteroidales bacterium]
MFRDIKILRQHGKQYVPDLRKADLPLIFRGRPEISPDITEAEAKALMLLCPVGAISVSSGLSIDLGKCVFCKECAFACPDKIVFTHDYRLAANDRQKLVVHSGQKNGIVLDPSKIRPEIRKTFRGSLKLRQVSAAGDNSCEMELNAAGNVNFDMGRFGIEFVASPRHADGVVITGPISANMAQALQITWDAVPDPKILILAGTDAISGGIFAESPAIDRTFLAKHKVDLYIPGNPAHPLTIINGLLDLLGVK